MKGEKFAGSPMVGACEKGNLDSVKALVEGHVVEKTGMSVDKMLNRKERIQIFFFAFQPNYILPKARYLVLGRSHGVRLKGKEEDLNGLF